MLLCLQLTAGTQTPPGRAVCLLMGEGDWKQLPVFHLSFSSLFLTSFLLQLFPLPVTRLWSAGFCFSEGGEGTAWGWFARCAVRGCCGRPGRGSAPRSVAGTPSSPTAPCSSPTSSPGTLAPTRAALPTGGPRAGRFSCRSQVNYLLLRTGGVAQGSSFMVIDHRLSKASCRNKLPLLPRGSVEVAGPLLVLLHDKAFALKYFLPGVVACL